MIIIIGVFAPFYLTNSINQSTLSSMEVTSFESRLQLAKQTYFLIADFPLTGGGLGSFPGLYSQYIMVMPFFLFNYSLNLFLDLALEQGIFGFIFWVIIIFICLSNLGHELLKKHKNLDHFLLYSAIFSSLITFLIHGIIDDPIYSSSWVLPLLFLIPGLTISLSETESANHQKSHFDVIPSLTIIAIISISTFLFSKQVRASWYSNIGAVNMAKIELADWPSNEWNEQRGLSTFSQVKKQQDKSISLQDNNFSANYRIGLIWMAQHNFQRTLPYLEKAFNTNPEHRGIQKNLGYTYTWLGRTRQAEQILENIPEANTEMVVYAGWWQNQGQEGLTQKAMNMANLLGYENSHPEDHSQTKKYHSF